MFQVKVPEFVAKTWREALAAPSTSAPSRAKKDEKVHLASLTLSNNNRSFLLSLNPELNPSSRALCEDGLAELDLMLQQGASQPADQMLVAVRDEGSDRGNEDGGNHAACEHSMTFQTRYVDGLVQHRLDVDPTSLMKKRKYAKVSRSRFSAAEAASRHDEQKQKRTIQVMTDAKIVDIRKPIGADDKKGQSKRSGFLEKRVAMDSQELLALLFGLFSKQSRWTFGQLQKETAQPTQHLKTVLGEIARLNKVVRWSGQSPHALIRVGLLLICAILFARAFVIMLQGPYKGMWELTKESTVHT